MAMVYVRPVAFGRHLHEFHDRIRRLPWPVHVVVLPVLFDAARLEDKSPGFGSNMATYGRLVREFCEAADGATFVEPEAIEGLEDAERFFCSDGMHLSEIGAQAVAAALAPVVTRLSDSAY